MVLETASVKPEGRFQSIKGGRESWPHQKQTSGQTAVLRRTSHNPPAPKEQRNKGGRAAAPSSSAWMPSPCPSQAPRGLEDPPSILPGTEAQSSASTHPQQAPGHGEPVWYQTSVMGYMQIPSLPSKPRGLSHRLCPVGALDLLLPPWDMPVD